MQCHSDKQNNSSISMQQVACTTAAAAAAAASVYVWLPVCLSPNKQWAMPTGTAQQATGKMNAKGNCQ